jgi:hypothetical protein
MHRSVIVRPIVADGPTRFVFLSSVAPLASRISGAVDARLSQLGNRLILL